MKKLWNLFILCMLPCLVMLSSCRDEDIVALGMEEVSRADEALSSVNDNSDLVQDESTLRWTAKSRVALVGEGRVLNNMAPALVNVLGGTSSADALTDRDLTNGMKLNDGVGADLFGNQLASVKDLNRVYEGGQKVGFVYQASSGGVLGLNLLKAFWIKTYLDGKPQESSTSTGNDGFKLLNLNVISVAGKATKEAAITTTLPFDEVKIGIGTLADVGVLTQFELLYAFVGDDPELIAATGHDYPNASSDGGLGILPFPSHKELVNEKLTDGPNIELLGSLAGGPWFTVDFGKNIPAGYEVGFKQQSGDVLEVDLGGLTLSLLDENNIELDTYDMGSALGVSAVGGGISYISAINKFSNCRKLKIDYPWGIKLGDTQLFYAYARKANIEPDVSTNYSIGNDRTSNSYYKIPSVKTDIGGTVQYTVTGPAGSSPYVENGVVKGMTVNGDYRLTAIYCDGTNKNQFTQTVVITRERVTLASTCNQMLINSSANKNNGYVFTAEPVKKVSSGAVVDVWTHLEDTPNLVDADFGNYVSFTDIIDVIQFGGILALQSNKPINVDKQKIRTGFTLQTTSTLLNLNLLKFFTIRLWNGDEVVYDGVADENRGVDVGLIGNSGSRIRCAIETSEAFDRIELFCYSVANINLGDFLRIYYAFWEPADECQSSSMVEDACQEMLTPGNSNLHFVFDDGNTGSMAVANIGNSFNNMANALDNDADSYAVLTDVATVIGKGAEVTLKFNEVTASEAAPKPIGVIYSTPDHLVDVNVLSAVIFKVYDNGSEIYRNTVGNLADIDLLGYSGKIYAETYLNKPFDQVSLEFPETVGALNSIYLYGVYTRFDDDNNGIPDCSEDPEEDQSIKLNYVKTTEDVCELLNSDGSMSGYGIVRIYVESGSEIALTVGERYSLYYYTVSGGSSEKVTVTSILNKDSEGTYLEFRIPVGEHYFYGFDNYDAVPVKVHPLLTKWAGTYNTDWNNWSNWTRGAPWTCTNVIIPSSAQRYPELDDRVTNCCAGIHFEPGGEVVNTHYLDYDAAWVDMELKGERYYMLSAPLKDMCTGDIFISKDSPWEEANYFSEMDEESYIEYRVTPRIYQRLWSSVARGVTLKDGDKNVTPGETFWTAPFNAVNTRFEMGQGFSVMAKGQSTNRFYFPKMHKIYNYFYSTGNPTGKSDKTYRTGDGYRFIYEGTGTSDGKWQVTLKNTEGYNNGKTSTFLLGNPFMAHVDIQKFLKENESVLSQEVKVYDGTTLNSEIKADDQLLSSSGDAYAYIAPMQSVFVTAEDNEQGSITVTFTEDMLTQKPGDKVRSRAVLSGIQQKGIRITATDGDAESRCLLLKRSGATDAYRAGEDAEILIDPATAPGVVVFTVADEKALDIQQFRAAERIPLGFVVKEESARATLKFSFTEKEWNGWVLKDTETGNSYDLTKGDIVIGNLKSNIGRLYLEKIN